MFRSLALILLAIPVAASAGVYRWVDADGHVHYTDKAEANADPIDVRTGKPKDVQPEGASSEEQQSLKKADCEQKKKQLDSYKSAVKIIETDSLGRKHEFSAEEQKQLLDKTQQEMQQACGASTATSTP